MDTGMLLGAGAFLGLFVVFVILPSKLRKRNNETTDKE